MNNYYFLFDYTNSIVGFVPSIGGAVNNPIPSSLSRLWSNWELMIVVLITYLY